jgi:hypothetical protein
MPADTNENIILDPLDHRVCLPSCFNKMLTIQNHMDNDLSVVIVKPAIIILEHTKNYLYHLRSVSWEDTVLFKSERLENGWKVCECVQNPEPKLIGELLEKGKLVFSSNKV